MPDDVIRETAVTDERTPGGSRGLASQEFFFLLQRIDRLDEKLSGEIKRLDEKLSGEINRLDTRIERLDEKLTGEVKMMDGKLNNIRFWAIGAVVTLIAGFAGTIVTLALR